MEGSLPTVQLERAQEEWSGVAVAKYLLPANEKDATESPVSIDPASCKIPGLGMYEKASYETNRVGERKQCTE
jgi:hypothetical protein